MTDLEYIEIEFNENDIILFSNLVKSICNSDDYYYSDVKKGIQGDVTAKLHFTLFYGLIDSKIDKLKLREYLKSIKIDELELGDIFLKSGYLNMYQILGIKIKDKNGKLRFLSESFKQFDYNEKVQLEFMPHLTLAYVKPEYKFKIIPKYLKHIKIKNIRYSKNSI